LLSKEFEEVDDDQHPPDITPLLTNKRLHWTSVKPTEPGSYWVKDEYGTRVTEVVLENGKLIYDREERCWKKPDGSELWAGPLTPPEGEKP
jgi:hypothetical protein